MLPFHIFCLVILSPLCALASERNSPATHPTPPAQTVATFSIVAFDPETGDLGVAVASKFFGVGSVVPWAKSGIGAVATQALPNVQFGPEGLKLLADGKSPAEALQTLINADSNPTRRQFAIIDAHGNTAAHTGAECFDWAGHLAGRHFAVQGNILAGKEVLTAMAAAFEKSRAQPGNELAQALLAALIAGQDAGGDKRGRQSAALLVVREKGGIGGGNDRYIDLRVEDHEKPIEELTRLLSAHHAFFQKIRP
jgi:uncharacterized Ntn-hydrolase superfamily protein